MSSIDFSRARIVHKKWKANLRRFLSGEDSLTKEEAFYHESCELGKWIYSDGMMKYGRIPEMRKIEKTHARLHTRVRELVEMKSANNTFGVERDWEKIKRFSSEILELIAALEEKVKQQENNS